MRRYAQETGERWPGLYLSWRVTILLPVKYWFPEFDREVPVVGLTGPPGAGKSSLLSSITGALSAANKQVGIVAVDPTSPFSYGAVLGDRIRMASHFTDPKVYIRSMATRGALGGLSPRIFEVIDLMRYAGFDYIFVETVGVGQSGSRNSRSCRYDHIGPGAGSR